MIWFTADTHFDHKNILSLSSRPFDNIEDMNKSLIVNWNRKVTNYDTVYVLGDFAWKNPAPYIEQLNGEKLFIRGSHDKKIDAPYMRIIKPDCLKDEYGNQRRIVRIYGASIFLS